MQTLVRALDSFPYYNIKKGQLRVIEHSSETFCYVRTKRKKNPWILLPRRAFTIHLKRI